MKKRSGSYGLCTTFICRISIIQGHVSLRFSCENFTYYKYYLQGFRNVKVTFQQISVAETVHTPSFQINSACWNYLESPSFSKFSRRKPSGIWYTLGLRTRNFSTETMRKPHVFLSFYRTKNSAKISSSDNSHNIS